MVHEVENFFGVYLLYNVNPAFKGRVYIGYTVDPNRRIKQHNTGRHAGGACKTDGKGPWEMVLIIHGFPNEISGLRFEWAWQHPQVSRRLKHLPAKRKTEKQFEYRLRVLASMLRTGPWNRLALTIRWLRQEYERPFPHDAPPPLHMAIAYGAVKSMKVGTGNSKNASKSKGDNSDAYRGSGDCIADGQQTADKRRCTVCTQTVLTNAPEAVTCIHPRCDMTSHMRCLSSNFLSRDVGGASHMLPVQGSCPRCDQTMLWGDVIRHKHGCYRNLQQCGYPGMTSICNNRARSDNKTPGNKLLTNGVFKNELAKFLLNEWGNDNYWNLFDGKTLLASYGGECYQYGPDEHHHIAVTSPTHLQGDHEEADTLIAFHIANITEGNVMVRSSDTDILVILIGALGQQRREVRAMASIIMDCGMGNSRRYINVTNIADVLEERKPGLPRALPRYHAFTGCDFTSAFYRKGKTKPLDIIEKDKTGCYVDLLISMGEAHSSVDLDITSEFVCRMYAQSNTRDVNEARYNKLMQMTGKFDEDLTEDDGSGDEHWANELLSQVT